MLLNYILPCSNADETNNIVAHSKFFLDRINSKVQIEYVDYIDKSYVGLQIKTNNNIAIFNYFDMLENLPYPEKNSCFVRLTYLAIMMLKLNEISLKSLNLVNSYKIIKKAVIILEYLYKSKFILYSE